MAHPSPRTCRPTACAWPSAYCGRGKHASVPADGRSAKAKSGRRVIAPTTLEQATNDRLVLLVIVPAATFTGRDSARVGKDVLIVDDALYGRRHHHRVACVGPDRVSRRVVHGDSAVVAIEAKLVAVRRGEEWRDAYRGKRR